MAYVDFAVMSCFSPHASGPDKTLVYTTKPIAFLQ
jgi:hypothetical protein